MAKTFWGYRKWHFGCPNQNSKTTGGKKNGKKRVKKDKNCEKRLKTVKKDENRRKKQRRRRKTTKNGKKRWKNGKKTVKKWRKLFWGPPISFFLPWVQDCCSVARGEPALTPLKATEFKSMNMNMDLDKVGHWKKTHLQTWGLVFIYPRRPPPPPPVWQKTTIFSGFFRQPSLSERQPDP